jgi:hypothetical protein
LWQRHGRRQTFNGVVGRKEEIANLKNFAHSENDARKADIAAINSRIDKAPML